MNRDMARSTLSKIARGSAISVVLFGVLGLAAYFVLVRWPMRDPHPLVRLAPGTLVIQGARIYTTPDAPALEDASIVVVDGRIAAVGKGIQIPAGAKAIECQQCTVTAGFWNAHVHFTEEKWRASDSVEAWNGYLADMLTSRGFTTVVDTGSDLRTTLSIRRRVESGELAGPKIYTAGGALYPPEGIPFYLRDSLPSFMLRFLDQPNTPEEAAAATEKSFDRGADILKLFTGSYVERGYVKPMPVPIAKAAVEVAHRRGALAFAHPSDLAGTRVAMDSGVDVLAHAPDTTEGIDDALLRDAVAKHMAMVPTLKMFAATVTRKPGYIAPIHAVVRRFHELGGQLIFGTDVGYMTDYTTEEEVSALTDCALAPRDILRMLTVAPSERFGVQNEKGTVEVGQLADLVLLDGDLTLDPSVLARPRTVIRGGKVLYQRQ